MDQTLEMTLQMTLQPHQLDVCSTTKLVRQKYNGIVHQGVYVQDVITAHTYETGRITNDGTVVYKVNATCNVLNPTVGNEYALNISGSNKMGAVYKHHEVTVFIPKHKCIDELVPETGDVVRVKLVGKRIESRIMCIGEMIEGV